MKKADEPPIKKKKKKLGEWVIDEGSDYPVHEEYAQEGPVKNG